MGKMHIVKLAVLILWFSQKGDCLNLTHHGNDVEKLKESLLQLTTSVQQMHADYSRKEALFRSEIDELKNETTLLKAQLSKSHTLVAFSARVSHDINLSVQQTVIFDAPLMNLGNAYHETYGHFSAPEDGLYQFAVSLLTQSKTSDFALMKNGNEILARVYSKEGLIPSTNVIEVIMQARDVVFVRATLDGDLDGGHYCIFSGFLIQRL